MPRRRAGAPREALFCFICWGLACFNETKGFCWFVLGLLLFAGGCVGFVLFGCYLLFWVCLGLLLFILVDWMIVFGLILWFVLVFGQVWWFGVLVFLFWRQKENPKLFRDPLGFGSSAFHFTNRFLFHFFPLQGPAGFLPIWVFTNRVFILTKNRLGYSLFLWCLFLGHSLRDRVGRKWKPVEAAWVVFSVCFQKLFFGALVNPKQNGGPRLSCVFWLLWSKQMGAFLGKAKQKGKFWRLYSFRMSWA